MILIHLILDGDRVPCGVGRGWFVREPLDVTCERCLDWLEEPSEATIRGDGRLAGGIIRAEWKQ